MTPTTTSRIATSRNNTTLLGHPKGLFVLFLTEMWERFSFYGMRAILVLFLIDQARGGLGWSDADATQFSGFNVLMVYLLGIPGGILADRYIGQRAAVLSGGILQCIGHFLLALGNQYIFFVGLGFIAIGTGLLKPNISTMVGGLYAPGDAKRDSGFTIFYMGINIGAALAGITVGYVGEIYGWHYGFGLAGLGMLIGVVTFVVGQKHLINLDAQPKKHNPEQVTNNTKRLNFTKEEKDRVLMIGICLIAIFTIFTAFEQAAGLLTVYAKKYTHRYIGNWEIPASILQSLNPIFVIGLGPIIALVWSRLTKRYKRISSIYKMGVSNIIVALGTLFMVAAVLQKSASPTDKSDLHWLFSTYLFYTIGELSLTPIFLSFITKVAPKQIEASIMGIFFAVVGAGGLTAGFLGAQASFLGALAVFQIIFCMTMLIGVLFIIFNKRLMKLAHGSEQTTSESE